MNGREQEINFDNYGRDNKDPVDIFKNHSFNEVINHIKANIQAFNERDNDFKSSILGQMMFSRIKD